ncbi:MAG: VPLPA-CTERM sorting domain-containing protein [Pseudomonadota bacterium]
MWKSFLITAAAAGLGLQADAAPLVTYEVALTEDGLGDSEPDWFGVLSFEKSTGGFVKGAVEVDGTIYDSATWLGPQILEIGNAVFVLGSMAEIPIEIINNGGTIFTPQPVLAFGFSSNPSGVFTNWGIGTCDSRSCTPSSSNGGSYSLTLVPVPVPAALPFLIAGVGGLALLRPKNRIERS